MNYLKFYKLLKLNDTWLDNSQTQIWETYNIIHKIGLINAIAIYLIMFYQIWSASIFKIKIKHDPL